MSDPLRRLAEDRALRDAARANFQANLERVSADLQARGIGDRLSERALREVKELGGKALDIADESKGIIAATAAAIALWLLRHPLIALLERTFANKGGEDQEPVHLRDSDPKA